MGFSSNDVTYFLEVARRGHIGRAAAAVGVTQPAISKAVRRLEEAVGVMLFERGAHGARLTSEGHLFLEAARRFDAQHTELLLAAADLRARHAGLLRVGLTNTASDSLAVKALSGLIRQRPGLRLTLTVATSDALNEAVENGDLDVAVAPSYPGLSFSSSQLELDEDIVRVAARVGHPLFKRAALTLNDLAGFSWAMPSRHSASRRLIMQIFERAGATPPRVALEAQYMSEAVIGMVGGTDLLAVVPVSLLQGSFGRVNALPLPMLEIRRRLVLLTRARTNWSPLMSAFRDALLAHRSQTKRKR